MGYLIFILAIIPLMSFILEKVISATTVGSAIFKAISIVFFILSTIILLTPLSFVGVFIDGIIIVIGIMMVLVYVYRWKQGRIRFLVLSYVILFIAIIFFIAQSFYSQIGSKKLSSYLEMENVTTDKNYTLIHRVINPNFMYPGTHLITVNKRVEWISFCEYKVGSANLGRYKDIVIPSEYTYKVDDSQTKLNVLDRYSGSLDTSVLIQ